MVYETLRTNPEIFQRTLLLITYDEHGGLSWIHRPGFRYDGVWDGQMASELGECGYSAPYSTSSRGHLTSASIPGLEPDLYPLR